MCVSPILSPRQLETRSKLLNSPSPSTLRVQYLDFKQKVNKQITKRLEQQIKKKETYGIFPKGLNDLRQETLKEVSLHRELNLYKKQASLSPKRTQELRFMITEHLGEDKARSKKVVLEKLERKIMHRPNNPSVSQPEQVEQQNIGDFLSYVNWLSGEGKKKYVAGPVGDLKLGNKKF